MSIELITQVDFKLSDINPMDSKFLRFDLENDYSVIRIGRSYAAADSHYNIFNDFIKELIATIKVTDEQARMLIRKTGGGQLQINQGSIRVWKESSTYDEEENRGKTLEILAKNLNCKVIKF